MRIATLPSGERRESHTGESLNAQIRDPAAVSVDLTHQHTNHTVLVEGPEITIRRLVGSRRPVGDLR